MNTQHLTMAVYGLSCGGGGALTIERGLMSLSGVRRAYVNPATEMAYIVYDADQTGRSAFVREIERLGFHTDQILTR